MLKIKFINNEHKNTLIILSVKWAMSALKITSPRTCHRWRVPEHHRHWPLHPTPFRRSSTQATSAQAPTLPIRPFHDRLIVLSRPLLCLVERVWTIKWPTWWNWMNVSVKRPITGIVKPSRRTNRLAIKNWRSWCSCARSRLSNSESTSYRVISRLDCQHSKPSSWTQPIMITTSNRWDKNFRSRCAT